MDCKFVGIYESKPYAIFHFIEGKHVENPNRIQMTELISYIAKLHFITSKYEPTHLEARSNYSIPFCWKQAQIEARKINTINSMKKLDWLKAELDELTIPDSLPKGICHCDFHFSNLLFNHDKLAAVLDFDDANYTFLMYDLVNVIDYWSWPFNEKLNFSLAKSILQQYTEYRNLEDNEKMHLYDVYKLQILMDSVWFFNRGDADDFIEKTKIDYLNDLGRENFNDTLFSD